MTTEDSDQASFARALGDLKRRGSCLLVLGERVPDGHAAACGRLLGEPTAGRRRLHVRSRPSLVDHPVRDEDRVVTWTTATRGAAARSPANDASRTDSAVQPPTPGAEPGSSGRVVADGDLGTLATTIDEELDALAVGPEPGDLRLCVDSLTPFVEEHGEATVRRLLVALGNRARASRGMAHCHLPADRDADVVAAIEPAFDAVVELRMDGGEPHQRWHVRDPAIDSGWVPF